MTVREKFTLHGWLNLYKPKNMSSNQAVGAVKRLLRPQKIGHAGTLDPLAEGILPLALGEATKTVPYMMDARKTYTFGIGWGESRSTDDAEGEVTGRADKIPSLEEIQAILPSFTGEIEQVPPAYSAIKVDGKRAYALARSGEEVALKARKVTIFDLVLDSRFRGNDNEKANEDLSEKISHEPAERSTQSIATSGSEDLSGIFQVSCSKGTYVRSLARDIALALGTLGYVNYLRRDAVGKFSLQGAISLDFLEKFVHNAPTLADMTSADWLLPLSVALDDIPALTIDEATLTLLRHGQFVTLNAPTGAHELQAEYQGQTVAIIERRADGLWKPKRVFNL